MTGRRVGRWVLGLTLLAVVVWGLANRDAIDGAAVEAWLSGLGWWAGPAFVAAYFLGTLLFVPGSLMTLAGGAAFGPVYGTLWSLAGATAGATAAFLVARFLGGDWLRQRLEGRLARLVRGIEEDGWRFVAFVRLVPLVPFNLLNYALGLTRIRLGPYALTSAVCMAPGAAAYAYLGHAGREAASGAGSAIESALIGLALLAAAAYLLPRLARYLRARKDE